MVDKPERYTARQVRALRDDSGLSMFDAKRNLQRKYIADFDAHVASRISELSPDDPMFDILRLLHERIQEGEQL